MTASSRPISKAAKIGKRVRKALARQHTGSANGQTEEFPRVYIGRPGHGRVIRLPLPAPANTNGTAAIPNPKVTGALPRPPANKGATPADWAPPRLKMSATPKVSRGLRWQRYRVWFFILTQFLMGALVDWWQGVNRADKRARRLRLLLEQHGGALVSIGRQLAVRLVAFPIAYAKELALMQDQTPPLPMTTTIALIEQRSGRRFADLFTTFDPTPLATSAMSCIYQAILRDTHEKVVVKVRRPGVPELFAADFQIFFQLFRFWAFITLTPSTDNATYHQALRRILMDELDFRRSAYDTELFARQARKSKKRFFTAPPIHFALTSEDLLVQGFAEGMGLHELLVAVEQGDAAALAEMHRLQIDPRTVARRLLFVQHWAVYEHLTFPATPRLSNIMVGPNSTLIFLAFGASGALEEERRDLLARCYESQRQRDVWGMVQAALALLEPLPPRDLNALAKEIQAAFYEYLLAVADKGAPWYEQSSVALWMALFRVTRRHKLAAPTDLLLYVRSTIFFDTVTARLDPTIDYAKIYKRYQRDVERRTRKRGLKWLRQRLRQGIVTTDELITLEKVVATGRDLLFRLQRFLATPYDFAIITHTVEKWVTTLLAVSRFLVLTLGLLGIGIAIDIAGHALAGTHADWPTMRQEVFANPWFQGALGVLAVIHLRLILFRLGDKKRTDR